MQLRADERNCCLAGEQLNKPRLVFAEYFAWFLAEHHQCSNHGVFLNHRDTHDRAVEARVVAHDVTLGNLGVGVEDDCLSRPDNHSGEAFTDGEGQSLLANHAGVDSLRVGARSLVYQGDRPRAIAQETKRTGEDFFEQGIEFEFTG